MAHFVGLDVSVKETSVCVVNDAGKVVLEQKVPTEPSDIIALLTSLGATYGRIGIEAGPSAAWPSSGGCFQTRIRLQSRTDENQFMPATLPNFVWRVC